MKDLLDYILAHIVDHPEAVSILESTDATGTTIYELSVDPADMGRVIGRSGRIIRAIRDLARIPATKQNMRSSVVLKEA